MRTLEFQVCRHDGEARWGEERWIVRLGSGVYGFYLDKEQALLDALDAARDASESGSEAQVWVCESAETARIF
jgi:hypothetical protein